MSDQFGDDSFREFMDNKTDPVIVIIKTLNIKIKAIADIYSKSLDAYCSLYATDPLKKDLIEHIKKLIEHSQQTMDQFNYTLIPDDG